MIPASVPLAAGAAGIAAIIALGGTTPAPPASAHPFGIGEPLAGADGAVAVYTVTELAPCGDSIPYDVAGRLFEATVDVEARRGSVTPDLRLFNARAAGGQTYRALAEVQTVQGLPANLLRQGQRSTGRIYFDVTGERPDSVVVNNGMADLLVWIGTVPEGSAPQPQPPRFPSILQMVTPDDTPVPA